MNWALVLVGLFCMGAAVVVDPKAEHKMSAAIFVAGIVLLVLGAVT